MHPNRLVGIGSKIRVLDGSDAIDYFGKWVPSMNDLIGNEYIISDVFREGNEAGYEITFGNHEQWVIDARFCVVVDEEPNVNEMKFDSLTNLI